jgi:hypothetical protein
MTVLQGTGPTRMRAKDALYKVATGIHRAVFNVSKGRIFGKAFGMPIIELITTGRKSGKERSTMLAAPIADGEEKDKLWPQITSRYQGYANYQKRTERRIPVIILEPR